MRIFADKQQMSEFQGKLAGSNTRPVYCSEFLDSWECEIRYLVFVIPNIVKHCSHVCRLVYQQGPNISCSLSIHSMPSFSFLGSESNDTHNESFLHNIVHSRYLLFPDVHLLLIIKLGDMTQWQVKAHLDNFIEGCFPWS